MFPVPHAPRSIRLTPYKVLLHAVRAYSRRQSRKTFGVYLTETHLPQQLAQSILEPVVMPLVRAVGIDPVHFGLIVAINLGIGQQTPPVASVPMTCCAIAKADMWEVTKVNVYFVAVLLAVLILVTYVPVTGMGLVDLFYH
jgi:TRAP-type C4-dicarboxylate transport system permease large subunit